MKSTQTPQDARVSLTAHVAARGAEIRAKYGPSIGWSELQAILADHDCVRYPCELAFDSGPLLPDECAYPEQKGERPEDGFRLCVHPYFSADPARVPVLALYQLVAINYGSFASPEDAEVFGAEALGMAREDYYRALCAMADEISTAHLPADETDSGGAAGPCACAPLGGAMPGPRSRAARPGHSDERDQPAP